MNIIFCKIEGESIPLVMTGTSPFFGAAQFGRNARIYRKKFMNDSQAMLEILEASYKAGAKGIQLVPGGAVVQAATIMKETYSDFVITGSTFPGPDPKIDELVDVGAKIIFVHGLVSDKMDDRLINLIDDVVSHGVIAGVALHNPVLTLKFALENTEVKTYLVPFNADGLFMGNKKELEDIVNSRQDCFFVGMKTLAAGKLKPSVAYEYISRHNICAVTIGMVATGEAEESTKIALKILTK